jgi:hypothetical protein
MEWSAGQVTELKRLTAYRERPQMRLLDSVGRLLTRPAFLTEMGDVRRLYETLPTRNRPAFPLGGSAACRYGPMRWR